MDAGYRDKSLESEELRNQTHQLVEKMRLGQEGLSKCLQETLEVINSSKQPVADKSQDLGHQKYGILVQSYDLNQRNTTKQKLVALAKRHSKKNCRKLPDNYPIMGRRKDKGFAARLPDQMATTSTNTEISFTSGSEKSMQTKDNATVDVMKLFESSSTSTSRSASVKNMSDGEVESEKSMQSKDNATVDRDVTKAFEPSSVSTSRSASVKNMSDGEVESEKSMQSKDNATVDRDVTKRFEPSSISTSRSASVKNMSDGEVETRQKTTPNFVKRRRIIDKNVKVHYGDVLDKIEQEYDVGLGLNYSYSSVNTNSDGVDESVCMSDSYILDGAAEGDVKSQQSLSEDVLSATCAKRDTKDYQSFLSDPGNIKSNKRSIFKWYKGKWPTTGGTASNPHHLKSKDHKLLGYDWIASVLDNGGDTSLQISDEYFDELKTFWKEQQGRPINDINLLKNFVDESQEPQLIKDILAKSKIQSYRINDRLFPEVVQKNNTSTRNAESCVGDENKQRSFVSPRYVSVTVPNNLVEVNSAIHSHHRGSVDSSESLSLGKHCVLGWESSCLNVPAAGTTLSMKDALPVSKGKQVLTLEEAEDLARGCHRRKVSRFVADHINASYKARLASLDDDENVAKEKNATKDKRSDFLKRVAEVTNPGERTVSSVGMNSTHELLDSAYSLMRDLNRIKQEHKMKRLAKIELGGIP